MTALPALRDITGLSHLIFEGTLDRFPQVQLCAAHSGGYLPFYSAQSDHGCLAFPNPCSGPALKKRPSEYLRDLYVDSIVFSRRRCDIWWRNAAPV